MMHPAPVAAEPAEDAMAASGEPAKNSGLGQVKGDPNDPAGRRSFLVAGFAGAAGMGMIAAGWALARWPDAVIASLHRISQSLGAPPNLPGTATAPRGAGNGESTDGSDSDKSGTGRLDVGGTRP